VSSAKSLSPSAVDCTTSLLPTFRAPDRVLGFWLTAEMFGIFKKNVGVVEAVNKFSNAVKIPVKEPAPAADESSDEEEVDDTPEVAAK
jgi:hypothetical protein